MKDKYFFDNLDSSISPEIIEIGDKYIECLFKQPFENGKLTLQSRVLLERGEGKRIVPLYLFTILKCGNITAGNKCTRLSNRFGSRYSFEEDLLNYLKNHNSGSSSIHFDLDKNIIDNEDGTYTYYKYIYLDEARATLQLMIVCDPKTKSILRYRPSLCPTDHDKGINTNVDHSKDLSIKKQDLIDAAKYVFDCLEQQDISKNLDNVIYKVSRVYTSQLIDESIRNIRIELS